MQMVFGTFYPEKITLLILSLRFILNLATLTDLLQILIQRFALKNVYFYSTTAVKPKFLNDYAAHNHNVARCLDVVKRHPKVSFSI